jgi:sulfonate dioxygenase
MAPSLTTTTTTTTSETERPALPAPIKLSIGPYKELAPTNYDKAAEEGKTGFDAAKVRRPFWPSVSTPIQLTSW